MECTKWKIISAVSIILNIVLILSFVLVYNIGSEIIQKETICSINICSDELATSYYYDEYNEICYCYDANSEVIKTEYIGEYEGKEDE